MEKLAQAQPTVEATSTTTSTLKMAVAMFSLASLLAIVNFMVCFAAFKSAVELAVEPSTHLVVDRAGEVVEHHTEFIDVGGADFNPSTFAKLKQVEVPFPSQAFGFGSYGVQSREMIPCPEEGSRYCLKEHMYVLYTSNGETIYGAEGPGEFDPVIWKFLDDTSFLTEAKKLAKTPTQVEQHRHLTFVETEFTMDNCPDACVSSCTVTDCGPSGGVCCRGCRRVTSFGKTVVFNGGNACGLNKDDCFQHGCIFGHY